MAAGPMETIVSVAKVKVFRAGGQSVCFLEALGTNIPHAQRSKEVGGYVCQAFDPVMNASTGVIV